MKSGFGIFNRWEKRAERKHVEKECYRRKIDEDILWLKCERAIKHEILTLKDDDPNYLKKVSETEYKWLKKYLRLLRKL